jgi:N-acylethanolamine-hydrolysing acid amidase
MENITETNIVNFLDTKVCTKLPHDRQEECKSIVDQLPKYIPIVFDRWNVSRICMDMGYCAHSVNQPRDLQSMPTFKINLQDPPASRWKQVCSIPAFQKAWIQFINDLDTFFGEYSHVIEKLGRFVNSKLPQEYAEEIYGCAGYLFNETQQEKWGWLTILNIGYEISDACTSIVAKLPNGTVIHGRNMDFSIGGPLTNTLKDVVLVAKVYDGDELKYITTTFAGFIGVITGQKPGGYSVTVDTRFYPQGLWELFFEAIVAITERNYTLVSFLARDTLTNVNRYENAVEKLSYGNLIADVYYIVAGLNDGAIITRNRTGPVDIWRLTSGVASDKASYSKSGVASDKASYSKSGVASDKASYSKSGLFKERRRKRSVVYFGNKL